MLRRLYSHTKWLIFPCRAAGIEERVGRYVTQSVLLMGMQPLFIGMLLLIGLLRLIGILHIPTIPPVTYCSDIHICCNQQAMFP